MKKKSLYEACIQSETNIFREWPWPNILLGRISLEILKKTSTLKMNYSIVCADKSSIDSIRLHETTKIYLFDAKIRQK